MGFAPMSLPNFSTRAELFSTAGLSAAPFAETDRYRPFARLVYPRLAATRAALEQCYCSENGRVALAVHDERFVISGKHVPEFLVATVEGDGTLSPKLVKISNSRSEA